MRIVYSFPATIKEIEQKIEKIKAQGFDAIQIPPIEPLKEEDKTVWWKAYQPISFSIGNVYGTKEELIKFCRECEQIGLRVYADAIINHMAADNQNPLIPHEKVDAKLRNNPAYWKEKINVSDWHNREDVIHHCMNLPGLNVYNRDVEDMIVAFLNELIDCGITGFRFDAAKSIGLPSEGYRFWPNLIYRLKKYGMYLYGEVIFEENPKIIDEYAEYMYVLGNYDGSTREKMVKYIETHDTYLSEDALGYSKFWNTDKVIDDYCNLVKYYDNTLFYIRPNDNTWLDERIKEAHTLSRVRKK